MSCAVAGVDGATWRARYDRLADVLPQLAPAAKPVLAGFSACVDAVHPLTGAGVDALAAVARSGAHPAPAREVSRWLVERVTQGRGGEVHTTWPAGPEWLAGVLGAPRLQLGGTGPQAAWALAAVGAPVVVALADRSVEQLSVLHPATGVCSDGSVVLAADCPAQHAASRKPHHPILEFAAGTRWSGGVLPRSSRVIVTVATDGIERDEEFAALTPRLAAEAGAGLLSGTNSIPEADTSALDWIADLAARWRASGLDRVHLELAEFAQTGQAVDVCEHLRGVATSVGLSLSELAALRPGLGPAVAAADLARSFDLERVYVHADEWSGVVHRGNPDEAVTALLTGSLLASARAAEGAPSARPSVPQTAELLPGRAPDSCVLPGDRRFDVVPTPWLCRPRSTVGLGDTFTAGILLAAALPGLEEVVLVDP